MLGTLVIVSQRHAFLSLFSANPAYHIVEISGKQGFMRAIIENRAALILLDGAQAHWRDFVSAPKSSAATRRVPILFVGDDEKQRAAATRAGADFCASWNELKRNGAKLLSDYARMPSQQTLDELDDECAGCLPPLAVAGLREFQQGNYYRQHDLFEELWMASSGPVRDLYRAILQVGVAYYQIERRNFRGALKMLQRSVQWLHIMPDACQGIDVEQLRRDSYHVRAELERLGPARLHEFDSSLLKAVVWKGL